MKKKDIYLEEWIEKMKDNWEEIGKLKDENHILCNHILCNIETGRILIEIGSTKNLREPNLKEQKEILKVINKKLERWRMALRWIENKI